MEQTPQEEPFSVITCDLEGRILTYNEGAQALFGYKPEDVIGRERVSLFSDGLTVLGHVPRWLKSAVKDGSFETDTAFKRKDGSLVAAHIKITPMTQKGAHIGYCGATRPLEGVDPNALIPKASIGTRLMRWLVITRAPFLTATLVPVLVGAAAAYQETGRINGALLALTLLAAVLLHLGTNMANDYFDWKSGTDEANRDYVVPFTGGSRSIQLGLIRPNILHRLAIASFAGGALIGLGLAWVRGWPVLALGMIGLFLGYFYTAPPVRLCARKGLGELAVALAFGPLVVIGAHYVQVQTVTAGAVLAGIPVGLLVAAILYINEFPDYEGDKATGKNNLVVVLGLSRARWGYIVLLVMAYGLLLAGAAAGFYPRAAAVAAVGGLFAWQAGRTLWNHFGDRGIIPAHPKTIAAHFATGILFAAALAADRLW